MELCESSKIDTVQSSFADYTELITDRSINQRGRKAV